MITIQLDAEPEGKGFFYYYIVPLLDYNHIIVCSNGVP